MDVCTLMLSFTITTQACFVAPRCTDYPEKNLRVCTEMTPTSCPQVESQYLCKRPDGTEYIRNRSDLNLPKG